MYIMYFHRGKNAAWCKGSSSPGQAVCFVDVHILYQGCVETYGGAGAQIKVQGGA